MRSSLALLVLLSAPLAAQPIISEIRIDQPGSDVDEYVELAADSLAGLTYIVIGDTSGDDFGVIESVTALDGEVIDPARAPYFVVAESTFTLGSADLTSTLGFENSDNVTHLLVSGFFGSNGQDLDTDNDGVLDFTPWTQVVDCVALIETPGTGDGVYCATTLGPLGVHVPFHAFRCGGWHLGAEAPTALPDTPGEANDCCREDPDCLYSTVEESDPGLLRASLFDVVRDHVFIDFDSDQSWALLESADEYLGDSSTILDLYGNQAMTKVSSGRPYDREHTWPQSRMPPATLEWPRSDHHALFLADSSYNISRSNLPFDACDPSNPYCVEWPTVDNGGQGGPGESNWRSSTAETWEVWLGRNGGRRGDVARALFYMDVRYEGILNGDGTPEPDLELTSKPGDLGTGLPCMGMLPTLLTWHEQDPPDAQEMRHNEVTATLQHNRNPFVDHPEWVACVFEGLHCGGEIFVDGFESGNTLAWSATVP